MFRPMLPAILATLMVTPLTLLSHARGDEPAPLRVLSFNIRYGSADDGDNRWEKRRDLLFATIDAFKPDLLGTQEVLTFQADELRTRFKGYGFVGVGRDDGKVQGEMTPIFFRSDRFEKVGEGHFWLSQTPETPGSKSWDSSLPRVASWVRLREKASKRELYWLNTHFDHRGEQARLESAKLVRQRLQALPGELPVIVTGDFNSAEASEPYQALVGSERPKLIDTYRAAHPTRAMDEGTAHGFTGSRTGARIDWVLHTPHFATTAAGINHTNQDGRYPSDHFPVCAVLKWK